MSSSIMSIKQDSHSVSPVASESPTCLPMTCCGGDLVAPVGPTQCSSLESGQCATRDTAISIANAASPPTSTSTSFTLNTELRHRRKVQVRDLSLGETKTGENIEQHVEICITPVAGSMDSGHDDLSDSADVSSAPMMTMQDTMMLSPSVSNSTAGPSCIVGPVHTKRHKRLFKSPSEPAPKTQSAQTLSRGKIGSDTNLDTQSPVNRESHVSNEKEGVLTKKKTCVVKLDGCKYTIGNYVLYNICDIIYYAHGLISAVNAISRCHHT